MDIVEYLRSVGKGTMGVANFEKFMNEFKDVHNDYPTVHVLGTNGKGSTTMMLAKLLEAKGYKVGTFTSPAVMIINDRIRINNEFISEDDFARIFYLIKEKATLYKLGFFEIICAIAFIYFKEQNVDYAIIEAGIGGKNDCTKIINANLRILTNIGLDHTEVLGESFESIALEKLGALNPNDTLVTSALSMEEFISKWCVEHKVNCYFVRDKVDFSLSLLGDMQKMNASLAIKSFEILTGEVLDYEEILKTVEWQGRFQKINDRLYIDGAHNVLGIKSAIENANQVFGKKNYHVVFSALKGKDMNEMYELLESNAIDVTFTTFDFFRAYSKEELEKLEINTNSDYQKLFNDAIQSNENYLFTGSLYFMTAILQELESISDGNDD